MSRGLGQLESEVGMVLGLTLRRPALLADVAAVIAHGRAAVADPGGGISETCDCPGSCQLVTDSLLSSLRRSVASLESKGIVVSELDALGRKVLTMSSWPPSWKFGAVEGPEPVNPKLCPACGLRLAGKAVRGER